MSGVDILMSWRCAYDGVKCLVGIFTRIIKFDLGFIVDFMTSVSLYFFEYSYCR